MEYAFCHSFMKVFVDRVLFDRDTDDPEKMSLLGMDPLLDFVSLLHTLIQSIPPFPVAFPTYILYHAMFYNNSLGKQ